MQIHFTDSHKHTLWRRLALSISTLLFLGLAVACKDSSVVSDGGSSNPAATASPAHPATAPATASSPVAGAVATTSPASVAGVSTPAAPLPSATTTTANATILAQNPNAGKRPDADPSLGPTPRRLGDFPVEVGPARIPTPQPDPFKARPTPTVTMENGKVKQQWPAPAEAASLSNPAKNRPEMVKLGKELYEQRCLDCHGREGKGNGFMSAQLKRDGQPIAPTNLASQMVQANTDGELFWKITNGKSPMPSSRVRFSDEERWAIVAYIRTLK
jgi:mono/diheme cytochrome c family protein